MMHGTMVDVRQVGVEGEFERYSARSVLTLPARVRFRLINSD